MVNNIVPSSICGIIEATVAESDDPSDTVARMDAVLTMELQRGVCGDLASFAALRDEVTAHGIGAAAGRLCAAARATGKPVVHCTFSMTPDRADTDLSIPLMSAARKNPHYLLHGTPACDLLPELEAQPGDLGSDRHHGVSPFGRTDLHDRLQSLGVHALVITGVSLNVGIIGTTIEAVNLGYSVVVAADAVAAVPGEYGAAVLANSVSAVGRVCTVDEIIAEWLLPR